jgi:predicted enzyme related to lactoylglutathione lyase
MAGDLIHFELPARDTARAKDFWSSLFGWQFRTWSGPVEYHMTQGVEPGGAIFRAEESPVGHPVVYFGTDDIDATIARIRELGGEAGDRQPIPHVGWFARCKDSEGNAFSLFQSDESAAAPG